MIKIDLTNGGTISTLNSQGDGCGSITIAEGGVTKGTVILTANELAMLITDLRRVYLSLASLED